LLPSGERAKNARTISLPSVLQHYLVATATSLNKLENKVQMHHLHVKRFHMVKRLRKSVQYTPEIFDYICQFWTMSYQMYAN